ncbi:G-type lectin S-receptor-like serine/threonine-protein kinase LECRK1 [Amborella trichopoda]|uniref:G-type lectin S-receptor-like serine/threonine-protein kinase LECRK1 n=1 Tax=Amborella trichopoda TaxID=13333 RepID=UPI0005D32675|nr:G-type lectin S-receptor-like serine/threonine-protein kinase LECRK1 [Amborella trichopoda]|eukprot:XP_011625516.1 G-type lectin S-receptor-like serine/threonine-protein kinase LECRK1 [Amborella trichopoda]
MLDTGNLVLVDSSSSVIWQSFNYPTDTLLPGQTLGQGKALNSTLMDGNYGTGRLMLIMQNDGNLVLYPRDRILPSPDGAYYFTGTAGTQPPVNMLFNTAGAIYLLNSTNDVIDTVSSTVISPIDDYYHRATLDSNGYFRQYSHRKSSSGGQSWTVVSSVPNNINACAVPSICGINSHCILDQNAKIKCLCPDNFSFRDPNNCSGGCEKDFTVDYSGDYGSFQITPWNYRMLTGLLETMKCRKRAGFRWVPISNEPAENNLMSNLLSFKYTHLKDATNGSFGTVYKGVPDFGIQVDIAVKPLDKVAELGEE